MLCIRLGEQEQLELEATELCVSFKRIASLLLVEYEHCPIAQFLPLACGC
jgi:hypothetical protein